MKDSQSGLGVESQLLATYRGEGVRLHLNAGGFSDGRETLTNSGWRASALVEIPTGDSRFGFEVFAKNANAQLCGTGPGPELDPGDIVVMDNLAHKVAGMPSKPPAQPCCICRPTVPTATRSRWPSPNSRRSFDDLWDAIAAAIDAFTSTECENYGYDRD